MFLSDINALGYILGRQGANRFWTCIFTHKIDKTCREPRPGLVAAMPG